MPRQAPTPPPPAPPQYRVLSTLERPAGHPQGGFWFADEILSAAELSAASIATLMERGIIMPYLDPAYIAALPLV